MSNCEAEDLGNVVPLTSVPPSNEKRWEVVFYIYAGIYLVQEVSGEVIIERLDLLETTTLSPANRRCACTESHELSESIRRETGYQMFTLDTASSNAPANDPPVAARFSRRD